MKTSIKKFEDKAGNTIAIDGTLPVYGKKAGDYWLTYSPHFKTFGYSKVDKDKSVEDLKLALNTFFDIHIERGTLETALFKLGWKKVKDVFSKPKFFNTPSHKSTLELDLVA